MNYLSLLQHLAVGLSAETARPILVEEFAPAVKRATLFFKAATTDDWAHEARIHKAWRDSVAVAEPILWTGCADLLRSSGMIQSPLGVGITVTLYALTDCYARRFAVLPNRRVGE